MQRILMLCLAGALALAAASCKDEKTVTVQTICVNGLIYEVKTAIYAEEPADCRRRSGVRTRAFPDGIHDASGGGTRFLHRHRHVGIALGQDHRPLRTLDRNTHPWPYLFITAKNGGERITIDYDEDPISEKISHGSLSVTKNGDRFAVKLSVMLSDGQYISADWKGTAKKAEIPE